MIVGRSVNVHPLAILLAVTLGLTLGGIIGALIPAPVLAVGSTILAYLRKRAEDTTPPDDARLQVKSHLSQCVERRGEDPRSRGTLVKESGFKRLPAVQPACARPQGEELQMGLGISILLIAIGAILLWAVTATIAGVSINTVGVILIVVVGVGVVAALVGTMRHESDPTVEP